MKTENSISTTNEVSFGEALRFWIKLGFISFGGPAGQIAVMQKELVENRRWIEQNDFLHALNFCMLLPGPEAQQLATYIGWRLHGVRGGVAAGAFFVIPSIFFLLVLSYVYAAFGGVPEVGAVLDGFKAVVVAIVVEAVLKIGGKAFKSFRHVAIAALAFAAIFFFQVPFPLIVLAAAAAGVFFLKTSLPASEPSIETENPKPASKNRLLKIVAVFLVLWLLPLAAAAFLFGSQSVALDVYLFFSQAAFVTFGGAYAVLAYVNQAVVAAGWITSAQAVDGLALAETTPGPLIMVLQFVGFMTGWNAAGAENRFVFAAACGLLATYATFLPSFLFIFLGAPFIERLRHNRRLAAALSGVTAAVVGVILNLALAFGAAVVFRSFGIDFFALGLAALAFAALYFLKTDVLWVVLGGGGAGLVKYLLIG